MPVAVRLLLAPVVVLVASLVQRRLGDAAGGRLVGLPLTTAPFLAVLALGPGVEVATRAAEGIVSGQVSVVAFAVSYVLLARRWWWLPTILVAETVTIAITSGVARVVQEMPLPAVLWALPVAASSLAAARWLPVPDQAEPGAARTPAWELPLRVVVTGVIVGGLSLATGWLGAFVAGVLSTAPVITSVLGPFTHRSVGAAAVARLMRGMVASMPATIGFVAAAAVLLPRTGLVEAFVAAFAVLVLVDAGTRRVLA